jgi:hypothetical protein|tara:strand:- start:739 stop:924 length:186 start_codon:yes stop_codon:yes gene_type:complete
LFKLAEDEVLMFTSSYNTNLGLKRSGLVIGLVRIEAMKHQSLDIEKVFNTVPGSEGSDLNV